MKYFQNYITLTVAFVLSACGGGGSGNAGNSSKPDLLFTGTVAIGAALQNAVVVATCADGTKASSTPTNSRGAYSLSVSASLPCNFQTLEPTTGFALRSISSTDGTVNITPLSEAIYVFASGDPTKIFEAKAKLSVLMTSINSPLAGDPISTPFEANATGLDKNILDLITFLANTIDSVPAISPRALAALPAVFASLNSNCGSTDSRCIANESLLAKVGDLDSRAIARDIFIELDSRLFAGVGNSLYTRSFDPITRNALERGYKYAISILIDRVGPSIMKSSGISKTVAIQMATSFSDEAITTVLAAPKMRTGDILELLVGSVVNVLVDHIEDATIPTLVLNDTESNVLKSFAWGSGAYVLEIAVGDAVFCAFHSWACSNVLGLQLVTLKTEVETLFSRLFKDLSALAETNKLNSDVSATNTRNAVIEQLIAQYANLSDAKYAGARAWATSGGMNGPLSAYTQPKIAAARAAMTTVFPANIELPWRIQISNQHNRRLDRLSTKWALIETTCRTFQSNASDREVGISNCLNAMRIEPLAPISCDQNQTLFQGACIPTTLTTTVFLDTFDGTALDTAKWLVSTAASTCCGPGNPAVIDVSSGYLNVAVPGGSCGACGVGDGSVLRPVIPPLSGDFEITVSAEEIERLRKDNHSAMSVLALEITGGNANLGIYIRGDVKGNTGAPGHTIELYSNVAGVLDYLNITELTVGKYYSFEFRIRRVGAELFLAFRLPNEANWTEFKVRQSIGADLAVAPKISFFSGDGSGTIVNSSFKSRLAFVSIKQTI